MEEIVKQHLFESLREKYHRASKSEKSEMLTELCRERGIHRKHAIRLFKKRRPGRKPAGKKRGPKSRYADPEFLKGLRLVWREMEGRASKLIKADLPEWMPSIEKHNGNFEESVRDRLLTISAATIDRYLKPYKVKRRGRKS